MSKSVKVESKLVVARGWRERATANGLRCFFFRVMKAFWS